MPIRVVITHTLGEIPVFLNGLSEGPVKRAVARSIRRTFQGMRTQTAKGIRDHQLVDTRSLPISEIKRRYLRERVKASPSQPIGEMQGRLDFTDVRPGLFHFFATRVALGYARRGRARQNRSGVFVTVLGRTYRAGRGFVPAGKKIILARTGKGRTPLRKLFGPSFATLVRASGVDVEIQAGAQARYERELSSNLDYFLKAKR